MTDFSYYCTYDIVSYMAKYDKRIKARAMRKNGISIIVIARKLAVSKSSVSLWCRDIILTEEQSKKLVKNKGVSLTTGQRMGAETNRKKKTDVIKTSDVFGKRIIKKISKTDSTSTFIFVNSDPDMILIMKKFLIYVMEVPLEDIVCSIQINRMHENRIKKVLIFWKKLLKLKSYQIRKPYFVNTKVNKVYENYDRYYGVCRLFVRRGKHLKYRMLGLIKAMKNDILSG